MCLLTMTLEDNLSPCIAIDYQYTHVQSKPAYTDNTQGTAEQNMYSDSIFEVFYISSDRLLWAISLVLVCTSLYI